ncbi:hypothetical protein UlMin_009517 [Ulmus minor]
MNPNRLYAVKPLEVVRPPKLTTHLSHLHKLNTLIPSGNSNRETSVRTRLSKKIQKIVGACYPLVHASSEGLSFAYQLLYLLDASGFYSLGLHALGIHVCRATGQELMDTSSRISKIRNRERERLCGPPWLKAIQGVLLKCTYTMLDYAQPGLIVAVFFFKLLRTRVVTQSAEERMSALAVYPPPLLPPPPQVAKEGIPLYFGITKLCRTRNRVPRLMINHAAARFGSLGISVKYSVLIREL